MKEKILVIALVGFFALVGFMNYVSNHDYGVKTEASIKAQYENMENILGQYSLKVMESVQLPQKKANDLAKVMKDTMQGRYGETGSQATMQWIQENYAGQITDELYLKVSRLIESGRNEFKNSQTMFTDTKRAYETELGNFWSGMWLGYAGFPKIDLDEYKIISSSHAKKAFDTKVDEGLKL